MSVTLPPAPRPTPRRSAWRAPLGNSAGVALLLVLWVLTLLTVIAGQLGFAVRHELRALRNFKEAAEAYYIAEAGLSLALLELLREGRQPENGETSSAVEDVSPTWRVNAPLPVVPYAGGRIGIWIDNAAGRVDLNTADAPLLRMILGDLELDEARIDTIVDSILDWRDEDDLHRAHGAESDYYRSLPVPYDSKNADFDSVEELLRVQGVTPELFHDHLRERFTTLQDPALEARRLRALFRKRADTGLGRININAARPPVLMALPEMTADGVEAIAAFRETRDFERLEEVEDLLGPDVFAAIAPYISLEMSPFYTIHVEGMVDHSPVRQRIALTVRLDPLAPQRYVVLQRREG